MVPEGSAVHPGRFLANLPSVTEMSTALQVTADYSSSWKGILGTRYKLSERVICPKSYGVIDLSGCTINASDFRDVREINRTDGVLSVIGEVCQLKPYHAAACQQLAALGDAILISVPDTDIAMFMPWENVRANSVPMKSYAAALATAV